MQEVKVQLIIASMMLMNNLSLVPPSPIPNVEDMTLFQQADSCVLPCWNSVVPGESTLNDVRFALANLTFFNSADFNREDVFEFENGIETSIQWWYRNQLAKGVITLNHDIVDSIRIRSSFEFTMQEIIDLYGEPSGIQFRYEYAPDPKYHVVTLNIYYPELGLIVGFSVPHSERIIIKPTEIKGDEYWVYESSDSLRDFAQDWRPNGSIFVLDGWPGSGGEVVLNGGENGSFPTIITSDGVVCNELFEVKDDCPSWLIFELIKGNP